MRFQIQYHCKRGPNSGSWKDIGSPYDNVIEACEATLNRARALRGNTYRVVTVPDVLPETVMEVAFS